VSNVSVNLKAVQQADGSVVCDLACNGQEARITFDGEDVITEIHEPAQQTPVAAQTVTAHPGWFAPAEHPDLP
jgi:hypothetical protein